MNSRPDFVGEICRTFTAPDQDIGNLEVHLAERLGLSDEEAKQLVYGIVREINLSLFPPLSHLELIHTEGCNLACTYCFEKNMLGYRRMTPEIATKAIDLLFDYSADEPLIQITHFGGEPTMNFRAIQLSTEYAEERARRAGKSLEFDLTSNGVLLNDQMAAYFADHDIRVLLSIDGCETSHNRHRVDKRGRGTFAQVLKGLETLKARQPWIGTKMTVMPENATSLFDDVMGLYALGVNHFIIGHATGVAWSREDLSAFQEQYARLYQWYDENRPADMRVDDFEEQEQGRFFGCWAGRTSIAVTVSGDISPCSKIMGFDSRNVVAKLGDVWRGLHYFKVRQSLVDCAQVKANCEDLGIADDYRGGCFAVNYGESGELFRPSQQEHEISLLRQRACAGCAGCAH